MEKIINTIQNITYEMVKLDDKKEREKEREWLMAYLRGVEDTSKDLLINN